MNGREPMISPARRRLLVGVLAALLVVGPLVSYSQATTSTAKQADHRPLPPLPAPLAGSVATSTTTWATAVMGKTGQKLNLFWQLFAFDPTTNHLALVTPPGVADNGGIMVANNGSGSSALVGFGASQDLTFSPLALTTNFGKSWSPGGLPNALVAVPSALGVGGADQALALVNGRSGEVLRRSGSLTNWKTLVTRAALAATPAGTGCELGALEAVAVGADGSALVGASCERPGRTDIFTDTDGRWQLVKLVLPSVLNDNALSVLRLQNDSGLLAAAHGGSRSIIAVWQRENAGTWISSPPRVLGRSDNLIASGTGPGTTQFVLLRDGTSISASTIDGPGGSWHSTRSLPKQTATIAFSASGQLEALSVNDRLLTLWRLRPGGASWTKLQSLTVPISFGSSS